MVDLAILWRRRRRTTDVARRPVARVTESLEARRLLSATLVQPIPNQVLQQDTPTAIDLSNNFTDPQFFVPTLTYKATSDNLKLLTTSINGSQLTLAPVAGQSGIAHVAVVASGLFGGIVVDDVRVEIKPSAARSLDVSLGAGQGSSVGFRQADHTHGTISYSGPGSAIVHFAGDNLHLSNSGGRHVSGQNVLVMGIDVTGSTNASSITVRGQITRKGITRIGDITSDGGFNRLRFVRTQIVGDLTAPGGVRHVQIDYAFEGNMTLGALSGGQLSDVRNLSWADENFSNGSPISLIRSFGWGNSDNVSETLTAPYINRLISRGSMTPGLQLSGLGAPHNVALRNFRVRGTIGGAWSAAATANIHSLNVRGIESDFNATFASPLRSINDSGSLGGSITAPSIGSIHVRGSMNEASLDLTAAGQDLGSLSVGGSIVNSLIFAAGNVGSISARTLDTSDVLAGIGNLPNGETIPNALTDVSASSFVASATIGSISLHPSAKQLGLSNAIVAASHIGNVSAGSLRSNNGGSTFGLAAHSVGQFSAFDFTSKHKLAYSQLANPSQSVTVGDFQILIV